MSKNNPPMRPKPPAPAPVERQYQQYQRPQRSPHQVRSDAIREGAADDALNITIVAMSATVSEVIRALRGSERFVADLNDSCGMILMDTKQLRFLVEISDVKALHRAYMEHLVGGKNAKLVRENALSWIRGVIAQANAWSRLVQITSMRAAIEKVEAATQAEFQSQIVKLAGEIGEIEPPSEKVDETFFRGELRGLLERHRKMLAVYSAMREALALAKNASGKDVVAGNPPVSEAVKDVLEAIRPQIVRAVASDGEVLDDTAFKVALNGRRPIKEVESKVDGKTVSISVATIVDEEHHRVSLIDEHGKVVLEHSLQE